MLSVLSCCVAIQYLLLTCATAVMLYHFREYISPGGRLKIKVARQTRRKVISPRMMPTHPRPLPPRARANICDRLSSATDTPRSARQTDLEVILHDLADLKDEPILCSYEFHIGQLEPITFNLRCFLLYT